MYVIKLNQNKQLPLQFIFGKKGVPYNNLKLLS